MKNKGLIILSTIFSTISLASCAQPNSGEAILGNCKVHRDDEFGGVYINISIDSFNKKGFKFGDSVDLTFKTGNAVTTYEDIGYFSGYYVPAGQELLVGYKGYDYIKFCINYGEDIYTKHDFNETTLATIKIDESAKYKQVEETLSLTYSDERSKYDSDEQFGNFREIRGGRIKPGVLYRGASPVDNSRKRAEIVDNLLKKNNIKYNIDLADKKENISTQSKYVVHEYMQGLIDTNKSIFLGMAAAYKADEFSAKMKDLFLSILNNDGPYYIHCLEGKDRTGYVCMVIEALCGATYEELVDDYFVTYKNYYGIEKGSEQYDVIKALHIDEMIRYVFSFDKKVLLLGAGYYSVARAYLENLGLTNEQIDSIQEKLSYTDEAE